VNNAIIHGLPLVEHESTKKIIRYDGCGFKVPEGIHPMHGK
jgi:hypothetical protein